jgi:hypothetical protein
MLMHAMIEMDRLIRKLETIKLLNQEKPRPEVQGPIICEILDREI